jgi:lysozyme
MGKNFPNGRLLSILQKKIKRLKSKNKSIYDKEVNMNREAVFEQLKIDEGVVNEIYLDHLGYPTFGVGHLVLESDEEHGQPVGTPVNEERVKECFERDLDTAISECVALYGEGFTSWPDEVQQVLVNMMFNMGRTRLGGFKNFRKALEEGDWKKAGVEGRDSKWYRQVTNRAERLMSRLENV